MIASVISSPSASSENSLISRRMNAEISSGLYSRPRARIFTSPLTARDDLVRQDLARVLRLLGVVLAADEPLDREDRVHRVRDRLALGDLADQPLAVLGEADDRGRRAAALAVREDLRRGAFDDGDAAVRRAEVDAEDLAHDASLPASGSRGLARAAPPP